MSETIENSRACAGSLERVTSNTDTVLAGRARMGRAQETKHISRLVFVEAERSVTRSDNGRKQADALAAHYQGVWRYVDDQLLPTLGNVWTGQVGAGVARSDPGAQGPFTRGSRGTPGSSPAWRSERLRRGATARRRCARSGA